MDVNFENFMTSKILSPNTRKQYTLYFEKIEILNNNGLLNQDTLNEFVSTYKSNLVRSFMKTYFEYKGIKDLVINRRTGTPKRKKPLIMSKEDAQLLLQTLYQYNEKIALMVELSYKCALRRDEVCSINVKDIDWDAWKKERNTGKLLIKGKGDKQRYVIIPTDLMIKLAKYVNKINVIRSNKLFFKDNENKDVSISKERYWEIYHQAVVGLFGKKYKLHTLRHTKATQWFQDGIDIVRIQQRLGHSNIATTRLYINPDEETELKRWSQETS
jgi:integrase